MQPTLWCSPGLHGLSCHFRVIMHAALNDIALTTGHRPRPLDENRPDDITMVLGMEEGKPFGLGC